MLFDKEIKLSCLTALFPSILLTICFQNFRTISEFPTTSTGQSALDSTDGARAMLGRHSGVVKRARDVAPLLTHVHCCIHREALGAKRMPMDLKTILDDAVRMVNYIKVVHCKHVCFPFCVKRWVVNTTSFYYIPRSAGSHAAESSPGSSSYVMRSEHFSLIPNLNLQTTSVISTDFVTCPTWLTLSAT